MRASSLVGRVSLGAAVSGVVAALLAAAITSAVAAATVRRIVETRLMDAALVLGDLAREHSDAQLAEVVRSESAEMEHTGITFAFVARDGSARVAGDARVPLLTGGRCDDFGPLHACSAPLVRDVWAVAAAPRPPLVQSLGLASLLAALVAGVAAWFGSRPLARWIVSPLSRLREQVSGVDPTSLGGGALNAPAEVVEVDAVRDALKTVVARFDEAIRTAERFAADAAHELRTPLTSIRGELELAVESGAPAIEDVRHVAAKVVTLQTLIERLLVLALPSRGAWTPPDVVALDELVADVIEDNAAAERVTVVSPPSPVVVLGDAMLLATLISNAVGNATKFGTNVTVRVSGEGPNALIEVADDGPGVPRDLRRAVFEPFVRGVGSSVPGSGLGLAVIASVARRHGGEARFRDVASGAMLEVTLPRVV